MSSDRDDTIRDVEIDDRPDGPDRTRGDVSLERSEVFALLFGDPPVRNYLVAGLAALAMIFLLLLQEGSDLGGLLIVVIGSAGLVLLWPQAPLFVLTLLTYFLLYPTGIPGEAFEKRWEIAEGHFRPADLILAFSLLIYVAAHYRLISVTRQALATEGAVRRQNEPLIRRPPVLIAPNELGILLGIGITSVFASQIVWWVANSVAIRPGETFPFVWSGAERSLRRAESPGALPPAATRFLALTGMFLFGVLLSRLVFGYWRLRSMNAAEAGMIVLDHGWGETHRERSRIENWRLWRRERTRARDRAAVKSRQGPEKPPIKTANRSTTSPPKAP
jgi:hypothetical protein